MATTTISPPSISRQAPLISYMPTHMAARRAALTTTITARSPTGPRRVGGALRSASPRARARR
eukprot:1380568-Amorphochlora_amoeboformis.AAC.1